MASTRSLTWTVCLTGSFTRFVLVSSATSSSRYDIACLHDRDTFVGGRRDCCSHSLAAPSAKRTLASPAATRTCSWLVTRVSGKARSLRHPCLDSNEPWNPLDVAGRLDGDTPRYLRRRQHDDDNGAYSHDGQGLVRRLRPRSRCARPCRPGTASTFVSMFQALGTNRVSVALTNLTRWASTTRRCLRPWSSRALALPRRVRRTNCLKKCASSLLGIVCNLNARTSVIAAANPSGGHYNRSRSVSENLKMKAALVDNFRLWICRHGGV